MSISRRNLISAAAATSALAASSQASAAVAARQIVSLTMEGRVPPSFILPSPAAVMPPGMVQAIQAGTLENRGRLEYLPSSKTFRLHQLFVTPDTPFPSPSAPKMSGDSVGVAIELAVKDMFWGEWKAEDDGKHRLNVTAVCLVSKVLKGIAVPGECGVLQFAFERDNPNAIGMLSISFSGAFVAWATDVRGAVKLAPGKAS